MHFASNMVTLLDSAIRDAESNLSAFTRNPGKDFSRNSKLSFMDTTRLILSMGGGTLNSELLEYFMYNPKLATASALVQQRAKILPETFRFIFRKFTDSLDTIKFDNYQLLAVDGSDINIPQNPADRASFFKRETDLKGCNLIHLNALYDLNGRFYADYIAQPKRASDENRAFVDMVDRSTIDGRVIVTADRGYESYNNIAHLTEKGWKFLIRVKLGGKGLLHSLKISESTFDIDNNLRFTRNYRKAKTNSNLRFLAKDSVLDYLKPDDDGEYFLSFRVVKFELAKGGFEAIVTNLNRDEFPPRRLMELYHMRWGIETSFRDLKHTIGLSFPHSKKPDSIAQEIAARLTLYNFCEAIVTNLTLHQKQTKYIQAVDFTTAVKICRKFFRGIVEPYAVDVLIKKYLHSNKKNRGFPRTTANNKWTNFWYRIS